MKQLEQMKQKYPNVNISECDVKKVVAPSSSMTFGTRTGNSKMYILYGGFGELDPKAYMDNVIADFVENDMYNEFVESTLDNPWSRIIICDINDLLN